MSETATEEKKYTISKSTVECYKIRHSSSSFWADITVDAAEKSGRVQIASDFGSWQYYWGSAGTSFKKFLISIGKDYAASKFGEADWFDQETTIGRYKSIIKENADDDQKEELYAELNNVDESSCKEEFVHKMWDSKLLMQLMDGQPELVKAISPGFNKFWDGPWKIFIEELKKEAA